MKSATIIIIMLMAFLPLFMAEALHNSNSEPERDIMEMLSEEDFPLVDTHYCIQIGESKDYIYLHSHLTDEVYKVSYKNIKKQIKEDLILFETYEYE